MIIRENKETDRICRHSFCIAARLDEYTKQFFCYRYKSCFVVLQEYLMKDERFCNSIFLDPEKEQIFLLGYAEKTAVSQFC